MMMKQTLLFVFLLFSLGNLFSQTPDIQIVGEKSERPYESLESPTPITDTTQAWINVDWDTVLTEEFSLVDQEGFSVAELFLYSDDAPPFAIDLYGEYLGLSVAPIYFIDTVTPSEFYFTSSPLGDNENLGHVYYKEEDGIFKIELRNLTLYLVSDTVEIHVDYRFNMQVHLNINEGSISFHYGDIVPSDENVSLPENVVITSAVIFDYFREGDEIFKVSVASGNPNAPEFVEVDPEQEENLPFISDFPSPGTMYTFRFEDMVTSAAEAISDKSDVLSVFPNPGTDQLILEYPALEFDYEIRSATGQLMDTGTGSRRTQVMAGGWPAGMYFVSVGEERKSFNTVWIKSE